MKNVSRRHFMQTAGAVASAPMILGAGNKSGSQTPILGEGDHKYECIHDWGEVPASIKYGNTHGVCEDSQHNIYVHHTVNAASESHDTMVVFDQKGKFVRSWGKEFIGGAHGLTLNKEGKDEFLYLCDTKRGIMVKATLKGEEVFTIGYPKESDAYKPGSDGKPPKYSPTNLALAANGDIYIGDGYGSSYINQYNKKGEYIRTFGGGKTKAEGDLNCPHGIVMDRRGAEPMLLVADRTNKRLQYFTLDGKFHSFAGGVKSPCHFDQFKNGDLLVPDLEARVTLLDKKNNVILHLGEDDSGKERDLRKQPRASFIPGKFICPHGACFDHKGNIFVVEWVEVGRVTKLRKLA